MALYAEDIIRDLEEENAELRATIERVHAAAELYDVLNPQVAYSIRAALNGEQQ